jgi:predicted outer membrane repeat protein
LIFESNLSGNGGGAIFMGSVGGEGGTKGFGTLGDDAEDGISGDAGPQILVSSAFTFNKNSAGGGSGGAVNMDNSGATGGFQIFFSSEASTFTENLAGAAGGAVSMTNFGTVYSGGYQDIGFYGGATFLYNQAQYGRGGAIRMYNSGFEEGGSQVIEFGSDGMGGISSGDATFIGNYASDDGGAISMYNVGEFGDSGYQLINVIGDGQFSGNSSDSNGGAIRMENRSFEDIAGSQYLRVTGDAAFIDNQATGNGGAIYMYSLGVDEVLDQTILIEGDASFLSNTADQLGAAIYMRNRVVSGLVAGSQEITFDSNTTFVNNVNNGTSEGAITMFTNKSEADTLDVTLAFIANVTDTSSSLHFISNHTGTFYYLILDVNATAPTGEEIIANGEVATGSVTSGQLASGLLTGLTKNDQYKVYVVIVDDAEALLSSVKTLEFTAGDVTAPTVSPVSPLEIGGTTGTFSFISSETGEYFYLILADGDGPVPSDAKIISDGLSGNAVIGFNTISVTGLNSETSYKIYLVIKDSSGNTSRVSSGSFTTLDITPPQATPVDIQYDGNSATFVFNSNEAGTYYYIIRQSDQAAPDTSEIQASGFSANASRGENTIRMTGLDSETGYTIYVVVRDTLGNVSNPISQPFTTLDTTAPTISSPSTASLESTSVDINFSASEAGGYYYLLLLASDPDPDQEMILEDPLTGFTENGLNVISLNNLTPERAYKIHILLRDSRGNFSEVSRLQFTTPAVRKDNGHESPSYDISELIVQTRINNYYLAKVIDNVSRLRTTIRAIFSANTFVTDNFDSQTTTLIMRKSNQIELINQIIRGSGIDKFNTLIAAVQQTVDDASFDAAFEKVYGQTITDWYMNSAAPNFVTSIMEQGSSSLLEELINFELLRALSSSTGAEASLPIMDSSLPRVLRDILVVDAGWQKLQELVESTMGTSDHLVRQIAFERIYGRSFSSWIEERAIVWVKGALGIPSFQNGRLAAPKTLVSGTQKEKTAIPAKRTVKPRERVTTPKAPRSKKQLERVSSQRKTTTLELRGGAFHV